MFSHVVLAEHLKMNSLFKQQGIMLQCQFNDLTQSNCRVLDCCKNAQEAVIPNATKFKYNLEPQPERNKCQM